MALPDKLFAPTGSIYEMLSITGTSVDNYKPVFKYIFSQASANHKSTFPGWINADDTDGGVNGKQYNQSTNSSGSWVLCDSTGTESTNTTIVAGTSDYIKIKGDSGSPDGVNLIGWSQWGQDSSNPDLLNRSALLGVMSNGMFPEKIVEDTNYTIHPHYTYRAYRLNVTSNSSSGVTLTLPDPAKTVQRTIQVYIINASQEGVTGNVTISRNGSENINGSAANLSFGDSGGINTRAGDSNKPVILHTDGTDWYTSTNVGYDINDDLPVYTIRRMTQSAYNGLASTDPNTMYVIE
jgi:hypothetical protein